MRQSRLRPLVVALACALPSVAYAQGAGIEWDVLNQEVMRLYRAGKYDRAVVVAQKAFEDAEQHVGPNHPDVATSLENLAALYRPTMRSADADALERRAPKIRAIKR